MRVFLPVARGISETEEAGNFSGTGFTETIGMMEADDLRIVVNPVA